jgi:hypothetical protein
MNPLIERGQHVSNVVPVRSAEHSNFSIGNAAARGAIGGSNETRAEPARKVLRSHASENRMLKKMRKWSAKDACRKKSRPARS